MIVDFSVGNFRSIKDLQTISFAATKLDSNKEKYPDVDINNVSTEGGMKLLKTVGIYGANASGKSNVVKALDYFIKAIKSEPSPESNLNSLCDPFLFQDNALDSESYFQVNLILNNKKYRYGFTVKINPEQRSKEQDKENFSREIITNEWLYGTKEKHSGEFFLREGRKVTKDKLQNNDKIPQLPYGHTLFLTHAAAFDAKGICAAIRTFFRGMVVSNYSYGMDQFRRNSLNYIREESTKPLFLQFLSSFGLDYANATFDIDKELLKLPVFPQNKIFLTKQFVNPAGTLIDINLNLANNESSGTQKMFDLAGLLLTAFKLKESPLIILDELDSNFHPSLLIKLIESFNNTTINTSNAQLLFSSHDTELMSPSILRRDQIYFTEKDYENATRLFSLAELKGIRNDADFARQYLAGFYGALPKLSNFTKDNNIQDEGTVESQEG
jgi:AAA15 family ATPase/GTPase